MHRTQVTRRSGGSAVFVRDSVPPGYGASVPSWVTGDFRDWADDQPWVWGGSSGYSGGYRSSGSWSSGGSYSGGYRSGSSTPMSTGRPNSRATAQSAATSAAES